MSGKGKLTLAALSFVWLAWPCLAQEPAHGEAKGPHGGAILEVGEEVAHIEVLHDVKAGKLTLYLLGKDRKTPLAVKDAPRLNLKTAQGNQQVETQAVEAKDGAAAQYVATHETLKADPLTGRVALTVEGKRYNVALKDDHGHEGHKH